MFKQNFKNNMEGMDISSILVEAENSVQLVKDEKLREIAYEKILDLRFFGPFSKYAESFSKKPKTKSSSTSTKNNSEGPKKWLSDLCDEKFFLEPKNMNDILAELTQRSHVLKPSDLTKPLSTLCHEKRLRRVKQKDGKGKVLWHWVAW
ncbi:MAG: hypothetical protein L0Y79_11830 [Chlorobi bacterium]|nr:hypothetical protein [Chlorobiota bacterium]MCI0715858.1 hypothetical protein [Chlorobiota bacterium]